MHSPIQWLGRLKKRLSEKHDRNIELHFGHPNNERLIFNVFMSFVLIVPIVLNVFVLSNLVINWDKKEQ